jgi:hypothetical protein
LLFAPFASLRGLKIGAGWFGKAIARKLYPAIENKLKLYLKQQQTN